MTRRSLFRTLIVGAICPVALLLASMQGLAAKSLAECYLMDWNVDTAIAASPENVRQWARQYGTRCTVETEAQFARLREILALQRLKSRRPATRDFRFVVDVRLPGRRVESYYADRFALVSSDFRRSRKVDSTFQKDVSTFVRSRR